jgi:hypothetical protein
LLEYFTQGRAGPGLVGGEAVHAPVGLVADHQAVVRIEYAHALGQARDRHLEALALCAQLLVALLQGRALAFQCERILLPAAEVADRVDLDGPGFDLEPLARHFDRNPGAGAGRQDGCPSGHGLVEALPAWSFDEVAEHALAFETGRRASKQSGQLRIDFENGAVPRHRESFDIPGDVEGASGDV